MRERVEPISSSRVVKLKVCDPMTSQVDDQKERPSANASWQRKCRPSAMVGDATSRRMDSNGRLGTAGFY